LGCQFYLNIRSARNNFNIETLLKVLKNRKMICFYSIKMESIIKAFVKMVFTFSQYIFIYQKCVAYQQVAYITKKYLLKYKF